MMWNDKIHRYGILRRQKLVEGYFGKTLELF